MLATLSAAVDVVGVLPDGRIVVADALPKLSIYDTSRKLLSELVLSSRATALRASSDGQRLVTIPPAEVPRPLDLIDCKHYRLVARLNDYKSLTLSARFVQGDRRILTAGTDGAARLWDSDSGRVWKAYPRSGTYLADATLSPDGTLVITAAGDGTVQFWDLSLARLLWTLSADSGRLAGLHFEATDMVTRGFTGELARWTLSAQPDLLGATEHVLACLPVRFDNQAGGIVEQDPRCSEQ